MDKDGTEGYLAEDANTEVAEDDDKRRYEMIRKRDRAKKKQDGERDGHERQQPRGGERSTCRGE